MNDSLEKKSQNNNSGKTEKELDALGYVSLTNSPGYKFKADGKPMLYRLDTDKHIYFPSNPTPALKVDEHKSVMH